MISLHPDMQARQDSQSRSPLLSLISTSLTSAIPFVGQPLGSCLSAYNPSAVTHSSGRLVVVVYDDNDVVIAVSDVARLTFAMYRFDWIDSAYCTHSGHPAVVELASGLLGILWFDATTTTVRMRTAVVNVTGSVVVAPATISSYDSGAYIQSGAALLRMANNSLLLVRTEYYVSGKVFRFAKWTISADFATFSAKSTFTISPFVAAREIAEPALMIETATGYVWLLCQYAVSYSSGGEPLWNVYYSTSANNGATWGTASSLTNYTEYGTTGQHPCATQRASGIRFSYTEVAASLKINSSSAGWLGGTHFYPMELHFNPATRKLYFAGGNAGTGTKNISGVAEINVDTWQIERCWTSSTVPAMNTIFTTEHVFSRRNRGAGRWIPFSTYTNEWLFAMVLDAESNQILMMAFQSWSTYDIVKNVDGFSYPDGSTNISIRATFVDEASQRMYFFFVDAYLYKNTSEVGYIDLTEAGTSWTYHQIYKNSSDYSNSQLQWANGTTDFIIVPEKGYIITSFSVPAFYATRGKTVIRDLTTGALIKSYSLTTNANYPFCGIYGSAYSLYDECLYGYAPYYTGYLGEDVKRGLCKIDIASDTIVFKRPTWASYDSYALRDVHEISNGRLLIGSYGYGATIYDMATETWTLYDNTLFPGLTASDELFERVDYDEKTGMIFAGNSLSAGASGELLAFDESGLIRRIKYRDGTFSGSWEWTAAGLLVSGNQCHDGVGAVDTNGIGYLFWINSFGGVRRLYWGKEDPDFNLTPYLVKGRPVSMDTAVDGTPNELTFTLAEGHLFDRSNNTSLAAMAVARNRKVVWKIGEMIGGIEHWVDQGAFLVTGTALSHVFGQYPTIDVTCESRDCLWPEIQVINTDYYSGSAEYALADILQNHAGLPAEAYSIPSFRDGVADIQHQWIDMPLDEIVKELLIRFEVFGRFTGDDVYTVRWLASDNPVCHAYPDIAQVFEITPDDTYAGHVNRWYVTGKETSWTEILFDEELIQQLFFTVGWWGGDKTYTVYRDKANESRARYWRLHVLNGTASMMFALQGKTRESITYQDPEEKYCEVTIEAPNLIGPLAAAIAGYIVSLNIPDLVNVFGEHTIPLGRPIEGIFMSLICQILGSVVTCNFEVYARPVGEVQQEISSVAVDDTEAQAETGVVVPTRIDGIICHTVAQCNRHATFRRNLAVWQKHRVTVKKLAHLHDEVGDIITFPHPYSGEAVKLLIAGLRRVITIPAETGEGMSMVDTIEGWVL